MKKIAYIIALIVALPLFGHAQYVTEVEGFDEIKPTNTDLNMFFATGSFYNPYMGGRTSGYTYGIDVSHRINKEIKTIAGTKAVASYGVRVVHMNENYGPYRMTTTMVGPQIYLPISNKLDLNMEVLVGNRQYTGETLIMNDAHNRSVNQANNLAYSVNAQLHYKISDNAHLFLNIQSTNVGAGNPYGYGYGAGYPGYGYGRPTPYGRYPGSRMW
ncbi:hypothetical protein [Aureibacter tunicatorum]|uniref:Outer membrane protein beta-barrel domain-containing protein n=1 Tax=Aureibacter tunicatorum TaxID=866807 RepID=A0AAE3XMF7_9BACT|nr:hypothetical protein [Aureibacter tunicatorum]MDR6239283.1 hypothetical protein [Aureibacter tunicatorum]BDD04792.1 hypothetical protein AUTU_22750 [Aureibacter tunicatorum]